MQPLGFGGEAGSSRSQIALKLHLSIVRRLRSGFGCGLTFHMLDFGLRGSPTPSLGIRLQEISLRRPKFGLQSLWFSFQGAIFSARRRVRNQGQLSPRKAVVTTAFLSTSCFPRSWRSLNAEGFDFTFGPVGSGDLPVRSCWRCLSFASPGGLSTPEASAISLRSRGFW